MPPLVVLVYSCSAVKRCSGHKLCALLMMGESSPSLPKCCVGSVNLVRERERRGVLGLMAGLITSRMNVPFTRNCCMNLICHLVSFIHSLMLLSLRLPPLSPLCYYDSTECLIGTIIASSPPRGPDLTHTLCVMTKQPIRVGNLRCRCVTD